MHERSNPSGGDPPVQGLWRRNSSQDHVVRPSSSRRPQVGGAPQDRGGTYHDRIHDVDGTAGQGGRDEWWTRGHQIPQSFFDRVLRGDTLTEGQTAPAESGEPASDGHRAASPEHVHMHGAAARIREARGESTEAVSATIAETRETDWSHVPAFTIVDPYGRKRTVFADEYLNLLGDEQARGVRADQLREHGRVAEADSVEDDAAIHSILNPYRIIHQHALPLGVRSPNGPHFSLRELARLRSIEPDAYEKLVKDKEIVVHGYGLVSVAEAVAVVEKTHRHEPEMTQEETDLAESIEAMHRAQGNPLIKGLHRFVKRDEKELLAYHRAEFAAFAARHGVSITDDGMIILEKAVHNIGGRLVSMHSLASVEIGADPSKLYNYRIGEWHEPDSEAKMELVGDEYMLTTPDPQREGLYAAPHDLAVKFGKTYRNPDSRLLSRLGIGGKIVLLQCALPIDESVIEKRSVRWRGKVKTKRLFVIGAVDSI